MALRHIAIVAFLMLAMSPMLRAAVVNVTDIRCSPATGTRGVGDTVSIAVTFSAAVNVTTASSKLRLDVGRAANDAYAVPLANESGVTTVIFRYAVVVDDVSADLDYTDTGALSSVTNYNGTLPPPGTTGSLSNTSSMVIDGVAPTVTLSVPGSVARTTPVNVGITSSEALSGLTGGDFTITRGTGIVSGPNLAVTPGSPVSAAATANAGAVSISLTTATTGGTRLAKDAPIRIGSSLYQLADAVDIAESPAITSVTLSRGLDVALANGTSAFTAGGASVSVQLPAGTCQDAAGNDNDGATNEISFLYDPTPPVATITPPASSSASLDFTILFSEEVVDAVTNGDLLVTNGTITGINGSGNPTFIVTVEPMLPNDDVTLSLAADGVHDAAGNGNLAASGTFTPFVVESVASTPTPRTYRIGQVVPITVTLSKGVRYVHGSGATLRLATGGAGGVATCTSPLIGGPAVDRLTFNYTVVAGDAAGDLDYLAIDSLDLGGGTLDDQSALDLPDPAGLGSLAATSAIVIDGVKPTATIADPGDYRATAPIGLTVTFNEAVTGLLTSEFAVIGASASLSGSGNTYGLSLEPTSALTFATAASAGADFVNLKATAITTLAAGTPLRIGNTVYRVKTDTDVRTIPTEVELTAALATPVAAETNVFGPTGTQVSYSLPVDACVDAAGNGNAAVAEGSFVYDPTPPVASINLDEDSTDATFLVVFSETAASNLTAADIITDNCTVVRIVSTGNPTFRVTVAVTDLTQNFSLGLAQGAVIDAAGNESLALDPEVFVYFPYTLHVSAVNADGTYGEGIRLRIRVTFNEPVVVTGSPTLALAMDAGVRIATYSGGSGTAEILFDYTIVKGDAAADLDYANVNALALNGGTIRDVDGNNANTKFDVPGANGSLSDNADLRIDAGDGPGKPDAGDLPDDSSSGCGAGSGIAILLCLGWLTAAGFRRRNRH